MHLRVFGRSPGYPGRHRLPYPAAISIALSLLVILTSLNPGTIPVRASSEVFLDFVASAQAAAWASGAGGLPFPGSDSDSRGFACYKINPVMEDGSNPSRVLETHPEWNAGGWISGTYPSATVPAYAELDISFGFIQGAAGSDGAIFEVLFQEGQTRHTVLSHTAAYDSKLDSFNLSLEQFAGKTGRFILYVNAGKSSGQDWACWVEARITVTPPPPPTTTQAPPTTTQIPPTTTAAPPVTTTTTVPPTTQPPQTTTALPPTTTKPQPTTTQVPPTTTPVATGPLRITSGPQANEIKPDSALITWQTSHAASSTVNWGTLSGKLEHETQGGESVVSHNIKLENLSPATSYAFQVQSTDSDGNSVSSKVFRFTTPSISDNEKPDMSLQLPDLLAGQPLIRVEAGDNHRVDRVVFYLDGIPAFTDYSSPFEWPCDTSEMDEGNHSFGARAYDSSGNYAEEVQNGDLQHRFEQQFSPMKVKILSPMEGDGLCLILPMHYEITNECGFKWKSMRTRIDGEIIGEYTYTNPVSLPKSSRIFYDELELAFGEHVLEFSAEDEYGNWGTDTVRFNWLEPPSLTAVREVTRIDNYFQITLSIENSGEAEARHVAIADTSVGYQYAEGVYSTVMNPAYTGLLTAGTVSSDPVNCWQSTLEFDLGNIAPGETVSVRYYVIPVMVDPPGLLLFPCIGSELVVDYQYSAGFSTTTYSERHLNGWSDSDERSAALEAADYLMLSCPANLFSSFIFYHDDVNHLLATAARLAKYRGAVFGYTTPARAATGGWGIKSLIRSGSTWARSLCPGWAEGNGYLLIIGEMWVIPAFDIPDLHQVDRAAVVHDTDYPYADTWGGDNIPELRVGRIIGSNPAEMTIPLESSLGIINHDYEFERYGGQALLVSGPELGEGFAGIVGSAGNVLERQGIDTEFVLGEYFSEEIELLREALVLRGDYTCIEQSGHRTWEGVLCTRTHPPMELAQLRELISIEEAIDVHHAHGYPLDYTIYDTLCLAGDARGNQVKAGALDKDIIIWVGHGGPDVWGWVIEDKLGGCGSTDLYIGGDADPSVAPIDFGSRRPVVLAASCLTGAYARLPGRSIARAFLRLGAGVYIGNVEVQGLGAVEEVAVKFYRDYWIGDTLSAGDALKNLKDDLARYRYATRSWDIYEMNLYGDPKFGGS